VATIIDIDRHGTNRRLGMIATTSNWVQLKEGITITTMRVVLSALSFLGNSEHDKTIKVLYRNL
jgi:hypothetical protein